MNSKQALQEPEEYLNNAHVLQMERDGLASLPAHVTHCGYEHTIEIRSESELIGLLKDKSYRAAIQIRMARFNFCKTTCAFIITQHVTLSSKTQEAMIDWQIGLFDNVTVTHLPRQLPDLYAMINYAVLKSDEIAVCSDLHYPDAMLLQIYNIVQARNDVPILKMISKRFIGNETKYGEILDKFLESDKHLHLVRCAKTTSLRGRGGLSFEHLAMFYGFDSFSQSYRDASTPGNKIKRTPRRFMPTAFERASLFYEKAQVKNLKAQKLIDVGNVASELAVFHNALRTGAAQKYLRSKPVFAQLLVQLGVSSKRK